MTLLDLANLDLPTLATLAGLTVQGHRSGGIGALP